MNLWWLLDHISDDEVLTLFVLTVIVAIFALLAWIADVLISAIKRHL